MPRKAPADAPRRTVHIAVQGCCHGELDAIYAGVAAHERASGQKVDLLICCGDFQSIRCEADLCSMAVPPKYRTMGTFHHYVSSRVAPVLTLFIGGNHEASNVLLEQYCGGFVAPRIYYMGHSGVVDVKGVRIGGLSGIFKGYDRAKPYPRPPYNEQTIKSAYHVRDFEVEKLRYFCSTAERPVDVMMSHDWPVGVTKYGDEEQLVRYKPYFKEDIEKGELGNPMTLPLLEHMRPQFWCSAHLHCYFRATIAHSENSRTEFLALDKCTKHREFLDFIDIAVPDDAPVDSDDIVVPVSWLRVLRASLPALWGARGDLRFTPPASPPEAPTTAVTASTSQAIEQHVMRPPTSVANAGCGGPDTQKREREDVPPPTEAAAQAEEDWLLEG